MVSNITQYILLGILLPVGFLVTLFLVAKYSGTAILPLGVSNSSAPAGDVGMETYVEAQVSDTELSNELIVAQVVVIEPVDEKVMEVYAQVV